MNNKVKIISSGLLALTLATSSLAAYSPVSAAAYNWQGGQKGGARMMQAPSVQGVVTAINGSILTVTGKNASTTYTVDATTATLIKMPMTTIAITDIKVGDSIRAFGTLTGTNLVATRVMDGIVRGVGQKDKNEQNEKQMPGVAGKVTAINGSIITLTGKNGTVYTVDATNATVTKKPKTTITVAQIAVGDTLRVTGTVSGTNVTATKIMDGVFAQPKTGAKNKMMKQQRNNGKHVGQQRRASSTSAIK